MLVTADGPVEKKFPSVRLSPTGVSYTISHTATWKAAESIASLTIDPCASLYSRLRLLTVVCVIVPIFVTTPTADG